MTKSTTNADFADQETRVELLAGIHPENRQPIFEQILASPAEGENEYRLLKSPLFVRGIAAQDIVRINPEARGRFELVQRSGILALRVFFKQPDADLENQLTAELEKLGGSQDILTERALVYSIHFGVGFQAIEALINRMTAGKPVQWMYGNVYHAETGEPLNWWQDMLQA